MEKKIFPEKENQPLSNHRSDCYIYIYEGWHPLLLALVNGGLRSPKKKWNDTESENENF